MGLWKPFRRDFDEYILRFRSHKEQVEKEANIADMIEAANDRDIRLANQALQERDIQSRRRDVILANLSKVDYVARHKRQQRNRHRNTNSWLRLEPRFDA